MGFYNKTHTSSQHGDVAQGAAAAAPSAVQPAEEPAANLEAEEGMEEDADANPDALQWEGAYCSTADDTSDVLGTGRVVSVMASALGLPKLDSSYPTEDECYKCNEHCDQEFDPNNVDVYRLVVRDMGFKCSPIEFMHSSGVNIMEDAIPVANGNVMLNYWDVTCVKTSDGCLYNFDKSSGATYEIQTLQNNDRVIDYVDTYFDFFECNEDAPATNPLEEYLDAEGSIFPFATSGEKPFSAPTEEPINDPLPFNARSPTLSPISAFC